MENARLLVLWLFLGKKWCVNYPFADDIIYQQAYST